MRMRTSFKKKTFVLVVGEKCQVIVSGLVCDLVKRSVKCVWLRQAVLHTALRLARSPNEGGAVCETISPIFLFVEYIHVSFCDMWKCA